MGNGHKPAKNDGDSVCNLSEAENFSRMLLASYPSQHPADQDAYLAQVGAVFVNYPFKLVKRAVAPWGLPTEHKTFLPSVAEIVAWLDAEAQREQRLTIDKVRGHDKEALKVEWLEIMDRVGVDEINRKLSQGWKNKAIRRHYGGTV